MASKKAKFETGLFVGRFQPFHKGHLSALKFSIPLSKKIIIGIGSSDIRATKDNPLSSRDRIKIIKSALEGTGIEIKNLRFIKIPDFGDDEEWFQYILKKEPELKVVFSHNDWVIKIFQAHGIKTISPPFHQRRRLRASKIRKMIKSGKNWKDRVPKGAIKNINALQKKIKNAA